MPKDLAKAKAPAPREGVSTIPVTREEALVQRQLLHGPGVGSHVYAQQIKVVANNAELQDTAFGHAADVLRRLDCRDPLEEMLATQALWAHGRAARLSAMANHQTGRDNLLAINGAADRASDTFRKLMLALAEYRRPPRVHVAAYGQANVAHQQVVQQTVAPPPKPTNGQG